MDQIKAALSWLKEHHFWVLTLMVIGAVIGVWYTSSATLASQYKKNESSINQEFSSVQGLDTPFKPNPEINKKQQEQTKLQADAVLTEWIQLYNVQKNEVLNWPEELGQDFIRSVENAKFGDSIASRRREIYLNYIKETFPGLLEIIDAEPIEESGVGGRAPRGIGGEYGGEYGGPGGPGGLDEEEFETYLVQWLDQVELRSRLELDRVPSALQIWVLQEDLWVYETLLKAIANTNKATGAARAERSAVQTIMELKVGQNATAGDPKAQRLAAPDAEAASVGGLGGGLGGEYGGFGGGEYGGFGGGEFGGGEYGGFGGGEYGGYGGGEYGGFGGAAGGDGDLSTALLAGRYLGENGEPATEVSPDYNFGREFKRLPVRLVLEMDSKWLSTLMWELATAPMQVEIEEVRFNPEGEGRRPAAGGLGGGEVEAFDRRPTVGTVILQGIVYIFNEPDASIAEFDSAE